jgi:predicted AAA+ superfamily ATPase
MRRLGLPSVYASADGLLMEDPAWVESQWERARERARDSGGALLVLDEVHKASRWSDVVKRLWDEDTATGVPLRVLLLGSAPLPIQQGLTESLAGRFEVLRATQWSLVEMRDAFGWDIEKYLRFGGYPGAASLVADPTRWARYLLDSLVETTISRDILLVARVDKPALLRRLFELGCAYSGRILSYQKMLGTLQDAGNTTTLAHYLHLLSSAGMVTGLSKYAGQQVRRRGSSPKLLALDTGLVTAVAHREDTPPTPAERGRLVETVVGTHLVNGAAGTSTEVYYWNEGDREVDFVLRRGDAVVAVEVKSGRRTASASGLAAFEAAFRPRRRLVVGTGGIPLEEFLARPPSAWVSGDDDADDHSSGGRTRRKET